MTRYNSCCCCCLFFKAPRCKKLNSSPGGGDKGSTFFFKKNLFLSFLLHPQIVSDMNEYEVLMLLLSDTKGKLGEFEDPTIDSDVKSMEVLQNKGIFTIDEVVTMPLLLSIYIYVCVRALESNGCCLLSLLVG